MGRRGTVLMVVVLACCWWALLCRADAYPSRLHGQVEVRLTPKRVVLHPSSAVVHAAANVSLEEGTHTLLLTGAASSRSINQSVEETVFQIVSTGGLLMGGVEWVTGATQEWTQECNRLAAEFALLERQKQALEFKIARSQTSVELASRSIQAFLGTAGSLTELDSLVQAYAQLRTGVDEEKRLLEGLTPQLGELGAQLRNARQSIPRAGKLRVSATSTAVYQLQVVYLVSKAGWAPAYDVDVVATSGKDSLTREVPVRLRNTAVVWHDGPADWNDVELELNTGTPSINRMLPTLDPWELTPAADVAFGAQQEAHVMRKQARGSTGSTPTAAMAPTYSRTMSESLSATASSAPPMNEAPEDDAALPRSFNAAVAHKGLMAAFVLPDRCTVASGGAKVRLLVAEVPLKGKLIYDAVPKRSSRVFVAADILNDSPFPLIEGPAVGFIDGAFAASSEIPFTPVGRRFLLRLGTDPTMRVERSVLGHKTSTTGGGLLAMLSEGQLRTEVSAELVIKSFKASTVNVTVWDRVPLSRSEKIGVTLLQPSLGVITPTLLANVDALADSDASRSASGNANDIKQMEAAKKFAATAASLNVTVNPSGIVRWTTEVAAHGVSRIPLVFRVDSEVGVPSPVTANDF